MSAQHNIASALANTRAASNRLALAVGFGGLLLLMASVGIDAIRALQQIQASNDTIREEFLLRTRMLERLRADLYVSGTYVRDYLLETDSGKAEGHRDSLAETRRDMDAVLDRYRALVTPQEQKPFQLLTGKLAAYWKVLEPVFDWGPERRRKAGFNFLRDEVFPRRMSMLGIADQVATINESQMNSGTEKVGQIYMQFRRRLVMTILFTICLGIGLATFTIRRILLLEAKTSEHVAQLAKAQAELKQLSTSLVETQENERRSISRELHDEVGQALTGILVEMANLSTLVRAGNTAAIEAKADAIKKLLEGSISVVRDMALLLRPSMLDDLGLVPALQWQAREVSKRSGIRVRIAADNVSEDLPEEYTTCLYRIVQEALHNVVQHAQAGNVRVIVEQDAGALRLAVEDDGKGFDPHQQRGMGLLGIEERVTGLGGSVEVDSHLGQGTVLRAVFPLPEYMNTEAREQSES